ncbi:MAG: ribonuclease HII [Clostridiales bacterium]
MLRKEEYKRVIEIVKGYTNINEAILYLENYKCNNNPYLKALIKKYKKRKKLIIEEKKYIEEHKEVEFEMKEKGFQNIAGTDNTGQVALAGPVIAASVVLPTDFSIPYIGLASKLTTNKIDYLAEFIKERSLSFGISEIDFEVVEKLNATKSTDLAMRISIYKMDLKPDVILSYCSKFSGMNTKQVIVKRGKQKSLSLFAASILARAERNRQMKKMDELYPEFGFAIHKGYRTKKHIEIIREKGLSPIHRKNFIKRIIRDDGYNQISMF